MPTKTTAKKPAKPKTVKTAVAKPAVKPVAVKAAKPKEVKAVKAEVQLEKKALAKKYLSAVGKRKNAVALVRLFDKGNGEIIINNLPFDKYFNTLRQKKAVENPLKEVGLKNFSLSILVKGGGKTGQAEAARHGITKALIMLNAEFRPGLKVRGWLTRDARVKERKKPGLKRARRAPQWSKR